MRRHPRWSTALAALLAALCMGAAPARAADAAALQQHFARANELLKAGQPQEALVQLDAALVQAEALDNPAAITAVLSMKAGLQSLQRDYPAAEASVLRAVELSGSLGSAGAPSKALVAMNATLLYLQWGRPALALPLAQRAVAAAESADRHGILHQTMVGFLANTLEATGQYGAAQQQLERAQAMAEQRNQRNPVEEVMGLMHLADLRGKRGDAAGARAAYAQALEREQARAGTERNAAGQVRLARLHQALGHEDEAQAALARARAAAEAAGDAAPMAQSTAPASLATRRAAADLVYAWREIGRLERERGRLAEAEAAVRRAIALSERLDGAGNVNLPPLQVQLGDALLARAAWSEAAELYGQALATLERTPGRTAAETPQLLEGMARVWRAKGDSAQAEAALRREIALVETYVASDHPQLASALDLLAETLPSGAGADDAQALRARAAAIRTARR